MEKRQLLEAFLTKHYSVGLDTNVIIYFVEEEPRYYGVCGSIFRALEEGRIIASTSTVSLLEVLVQPYRLERDDLVLKFYTLLTTYPYLRWVDLSIPVADRAARLRALYNLNAPDAIQVASALAAGSTGFIGNDAKFKKVSEIECLLLDECL